MFWMRNKENNFQIRTLNWRSGSYNLTGVPDDLLDDANVSHNLAFERDSSSLLLLIYVSVF